VSKPWTKPGLSPEQKADAICSEPYEPGEMIYERIIAALAAAAHDARRAGMLEAAGVAARTAVYERDFIDAGWNTACDHIATRIRALAGEG
jgi:hypothetical protein